MCVIIVRRSTMNGKEKIVYSCESNCSQLSRSYCKYCGLRKTIFDSE